MHLWILLSVFSLVFAFQPCGISSSGNVADGTTRSRRFILGGKNSSVGAWPWQVLLSKISYRNGEPVKEVTCGGTIISDRWILTAAHCVNDRHKFIINAGISYQNKSEMMGPSGNGVASLVHEVIRHPNFTEVIGLGDDIALLKLDAMLKFDDIISPICLPNADQKIVDDLNVVATGFGYGGPNSTRDDFRLRQTSMPVVNIDKCRARFEVGFKSKLSEENIPQSEQDEFLKSALRLRGVICAGSSEHKVQSGDSGGPLVVKSTDGRWVQIGITSFGLDGIWEAPSENDIVPETFTDVRKYCGWIKETTGGEAGCLDEEVNMQDIDIPS